MIALALDTHSVIWLLHADARLSPRALARIEAVTGQRAQIAISSVTLVEAAYLEEKGRIPAGTLQGLFDLLDKPQPTLIEIPSTRHIIAALLEISRSAVPDMPDRIIAATAASLSVPLVSHDGKIRAGQIETIW